MTEFVAWPKIPRYFRDVVITEKIDGTNAAIVIDEHPFAHYLTISGPPENVVAIVAGPGKMDNGGLPAYEYWVYAQSRKRFITPQSDNYGFAQWVYDNSSSLVADLGEGRHFGEWWGSGIQRGYGLRNGDKRFSLFNTAKWSCVDFVTPGLGVVPRIYTGENDTAHIHNALRSLQNFGSRAAPGFDRPEGICIYHTASGHICKVTLENDAQPKGEAA